MRCGLLWVRSRRRKPPSKVERTGAGLLLDRMNTKKYKKGEKQNHGRLWISIVSVLFIASCSMQSDHTTDPATEKQAIERTLTGIIEAANAGDLEAVMAYFAEDAVAMPTGEMPVFGTRLIRPRLQPLFDQSKLVIFLTSEETQASGNFAFARGYMSGRLEPKSAAGAFRTGEDINPTRYIEMNEYLIVLQKDSGGSWKIARLMWHPMQPPPHPVS